MESTPRYSQRIILEEANSKQTPYVESSECGMQKCIPSVVCYILYNVKVYKTLKTEGRICGVVVISCDWAEAGDCTGDILHQEHPENAPLPSASTDLVVGGTCRSSACKSKSDSWMSVLGGGHSAAHPYLALSAT